MNIKTTDAPDSICGACNTEYCAGEYSAGEYHCLALVKRIAEMEAMFDRLRGLTLALQGAAVGGAAIVAGPAAYKLAQQRIPVIGGEVSGAAERVKTPEESGMARRWRRSWRGRDVVL